MRSFFALYSPKNSKNQNFEKWINLLEISSFYTCAPKIKIIWCMVPEMLSEIDKIFCHFGPCRSYHIWFLKYKVWKTESFNISDHFFCPFSPFTNWKVKILILKKNTWRYYHITQLHHKWQTHDVWFLRYGVQQT